MCSVSVPAKPCQHCGEWGAWIPTTASKGQKIRFTRGKDVCYKTQKTLSSEPREITGNHVMLQKIGGKLLRASLASEINFFIEVKSRKNMESEVGRLISSTGSTLLIELHASIFLLISCPFPLTASWIHWSLCITNHQLQQISFMLKVQISVHLQHEKIHLTVQTTSFSVLFGFDVWSIRTDGS